MLMHGRPSIYRDEGLWRRRPISKSAVRPSGVVVFSPSFYEDLRLSQRVEDLAIEKLVPEPAVEALAVSVLPG